MYYKITFSLSVLFCFISFQLACGQQQVAGKSEVLYNGIQLPEIWPPRNIDPTSNEPIVVPYLAEKPKVIDISVGRQLFVDDFLIERSTLKKVYHKAKKWEGNPVLLPSTLWEKEQSLGGNRDVVYLGHGGVFYDPSEDLYKMFYTAGWRGGLALATSKDLLNWDKPALQSDGSNLLLPKGRYNAGEDNALWLDLNTKDPKQKIKMLTDRRTNDSLSGRHSLLISDGKTWSQSIQVNANYGDYSSFFYNPFRSKWVFSIKKSDEGPRSRMYLESDEFLDGWDWKHGSVFWTRTDKLDIPDLVIRDIPQLYSLNAVAYESIMLGEFYLHLGPKNEIANANKEPKITELGLGFSRDGFHWLRPSREAFIEAARKEGAWDKGYIHGATGVCLVKADSLYFPYTGYSGLASDGFRGMYTGASIGMATLRRDGFVSLKAEQIGEIVTMPLQFTGKYLFVNVNCPGGSLRAEILDNNDKIIPGYELQDCLIVKSNKTLHRIEWKNKKDLRGLQQKRIKIRFVLEKGDLYSFWVTPDIYGASYGYLGGGSGGINGVIDTKGLLNY